MKKVLIMLLVGFCTILNSQNFNTWTCEQNPLNKNLIAYYTFNGNANDFSNSGNNFTYPFTSADYNPDRIGGTLNGNSLNIKDLTEGISPISDFDGINGLSVSLWLKFNAVSDFDKIISLTNGSDELSVILKKENNKNNLYFNSNAFINNIKDIEIGIWYQLNIVLRPNEVRLYLNNSQVYVESGSQVNLSRVLKLGSSTENYDFDIDDVRVYNKALSQFDIDLLYGTIQLCKEEICMKGPGLANTYEWNGPSSFSSTLREICTNQKGTYQLIASYGQCIDSIYYRIDTIRKPTIDIKGKLSFIDSTKSGFQAIQSVKLRLININGEIVKTTSTIEDGSFIFDSVKANTYRVEIDANDFSSLAIFNTYKIQKHYFPVSELKANHGYEKNGTITNEFYTFALCENQNLPEINFVFKTSNVVIGASACRLITEDISDLDKINNHYLFMNRPPLNDPTFNPICGGSGAPHNLSWFYLKGGNGDYEIKLTIDSCEAGGSMIGLQYGLIEMEACDFSNRKEILCDANCNSDVISIPGSFLKPNKYYYLFLDGCSGISCRVKFNILGNYIATNNDSITIGGNVWSNIDNSNETFDPLKNGGTNVIIHLKNENNITVSTDTTGNDSKYKFKKVKKAKYKVVIDASNFDEGKSLYGLESCSIISSLNDVNKDNDNNYYSGLLDFTLSSGLNISENYTIDFCFNNSCGTPNPLAYAAASLITDTICDIAIMELFCSSINKSNVNSNETFCSNVPNANANWFRFVAPEGNYNIEVHLFGCVEGSNSGRLNIKDKNGVEIYCESDCSTGRRQLSSSLFNAAEVYTLGIAGCDGGICNYEIIINGSYSSPTIVIDSLKISGSDSIVCIGESALISILDSLPNSFGDFRWVIENPSGIENKFSFNPGLFYTFNEAGNYRVNFINGNLKCTDLKGNASINVQVKNLPECLDDNANCDLLSVNLKAVEGIQCDNDGIVFYEISGGTAPYNVYVDSAYKGNKKSDSLIMLTEGFHNLKVMDTLGCSKELNFLVETKLDGTDLQQTFINTTLIRGITSNAWIKITNTGCVRKNAIVKLNLPNEIDFEVANIDPTSIDGKTLIWNINDFGFDTVITLQLKTKQNATLGKFIRINLEVMPYDGDLNPLNNKADYYFDIRGSYDPNDKMSVPIGACNQHYILKDQEIQYNIRFQNVGNFQAFNVEVIDTMSQYIDVNSIRIAAASHNYIVLRENDNILKFKFLNINLPGKEEDEAGSNGYISYIVKVKDDTPQGSVVYNKASIYFDLNEAVITNEVFHTITDAIPSINTTAKIDKCKGELVEVDIVSYNKDTIVDVVYKSIDNCDSTVTYTINFFENKDTTIVLNLCHNESVSFNGIEINKDTIIEEFSALCGKTIYQFDFSENKPISLEAGNGTLTASQGYILYEWINCQNGSIIFSGVNSSYKPLVNGNYKVAVSDGICLYESECVSLTTSSNEIEKKNEVDITPNPAYHGEVLVKATFAISTVEIYSLSGVKLAFDELKLNRSQSKISNLSKGLYLVKIFDEEGGFLVRKLVVE